MQEIEQKCEVLPHVQKELNKKIEGLYPASVLVNNDVYYDTSAAQLFEQAVFVRVRTAKTGSRLQFKFDEPDSEKRHISCTEREFDLSEGHLPASAQVLFRHFLAQWIQQPTWQEACQTNGLQELTSIHNTRSLYHLGSCAICIDHIRDLGTFVEAEMLCEDGDDTRVAENTVQQFIADIGGVPLSVGYVELALQRSKPELYQRGRYR